jgi:hypothetical protein
VDRGGGFDVGSCAVGVRMTVLAVVGACCSGQSISSSRGIGVWMGWIGPKECQGVGRQLTACLIMWHAGVESHRRTRKQLISISDVHQCSTAPATYRVHTTFLWIWGRSGPTLDRLRTGGLFLAASRELLFLLIRVDERVCASTLNQTCICYAHLRTQLSR